MLFIINTSSDEPIRYESFNTMEELFFLKDCYNAQTITIEDNFWYDEDPEDIKDALDIQDDNLAKVISKTLYSITLL